MPIPTRQKDSRAWTLFMAITQNPREMANQLKLTARIMHRRFDRLPFVARCSLFTSLILCIVVYGSIFYVILGNRLNDETFLETAKCPACYGFKACSMIKKNEAWLTGWSKLGFLDYVNVGNMHFGSAWGKTALFSKLGTKKEIEHLDEQMCALAKEPAGCEVGAAATRALPATGSKWILEYVTGKSDMMACPSERLMDRVINKYQEKTDAATLSARERSQLVTTLLINAEPILYQTFPVADGWPFPAYLGACGRFVVSDWSDGALPLRTFYGSEFVTRAGLALRILRMAALFTDNPSRFSLYWTEVDDMSFTVNQYGDVTADDGKHLVVVDRWEMSEKKIEGYDVDHHAEFHECEKGVEKCRTIVSRAELCRAHKTSDHNYYAICRGILSSHARAGGLLHDIPAEVEASFGLRNIVEKCARPDQSAQRVLVMERLLKALSDISGGAEAVNVKE